jgi:hypothetical protein
VLVESAEALSSSDVMQKLKQRLHALKLQLSSWSRTAKLWLQFMNCIDIIRLFIRAERTSNWSMHVTATGKMLNLLLLRVTSVTRNVCVCTSR